jgi:hypothetical protein
MARASIPSAQPRAVADHELKTKQRPGLAGAPRAAGPGLDPQQIR